MARRGDASKENLNVEFWAFKSVKTTILLCSGVNFKETVVVGEMSVDPFIKMSVVFFLMSGRDSQNMKRTLYRASKDMF